MKTKTPEEKLIYAVSKAMENYAFDSVARDYKRRQARKKARQNKDK